MQSASLEISLSYAILCQGSGCQTDGAIVTLDPEKRGESEAYYDLVLMGAMVRRGGRDFSSA